MSDNDKQVTTRDERGRFLPGGPGGPGRAPVKKEEKYHLVTIDSVTEDDWREVVIKALRQAKDGDRYARDWLGNYILGRPIQRVDATVGQKVIEVRYPDDWGNITKD